MIARSAKTTGDQNDPDSDLIVRIANGDGRAAEELVNRHLSSMVGLARNMLGDSMEAEDVAQEVFLKVWMHAHKWKPGKARYQTWMHRVAINLCYDRLRKKKEVYLDVLPDRMDQNAVKADQEMMNTERAHCIQSALLSLAPRQRVAITMCHLQELGNIEVADTMQISVEALESLLARGRRALREALKGQQKELLGE